MRRSRILNDDYQEMLTIGPFGGIDASTSPYSVAPTNFVNSSNLIPNQQYGGYVTVPGRIAALAALLPSAPTGIGKMERAGQADLYLFAVTDTNGHGAIYAGSIGGVPYALALPAPLTPGKLTYFVASRKWLFVTNGTDTPIKIDTNLTVTYWGIVAPSAAPTIATGGVGPLTGSYYYCETFSDADQESSQGAISAVYNANGESLRITPVATTTDPQVTTRNLYRIGGGNGKWMLVHSQAVGDMTPYLDSVSDLNLNGQDLTIFRDPPPIWKAIAEYQDRIVGFGTDADPTLVGWSNYNEPWGFNPNLFLEAGPNNFNDVAVTCGSIGSMLVLLKTRKTFALIGNSDATFTVIELFPVGCLSPTSAIFGDGLASWDSRRGIQLFDGNSRNTISRGQYQQSNIKTLLDGMSAYDRSLGVGFLYDSLLCFSYPSRNVTYVFDPATAQWFPLAFALGAVHYDPESAVPVVGSNLQTAGQIDKWFSDTVNGDLGQAIYAEVESRITDAGMIHADKKLSYAYIEGPVQSGAFVNVYVTMNPGVDQILETTRIDLGSGTPRHRWELPDSLEGQEMQLRVQTVAKQQTLLHKVALFGKIVRVHKPSGPQDG